MLSGALLYIDPPLGAPHSEPLRRGGGGRALPRVLPGLGDPVSGRGVVTVVPIARSDARAQARQPEREGVVSLGLRATYAGCPTNPPPKVARLLGSSLALAVAGNAGRARRF